LALNFKIDSCYKLAPTTIARGCAWFVLRAGALLAAELQCGGRERAPTRHHRTTTKLLETGPSSDPSTFNASC